MSNIIKLLEKMGQDANLQASNELEIEINKADIAVSLKETLLAKNKTELEHQLNISTEIICFMVPAKDEEQEEDSTPIESDEVAVQYG